LQKVSKGQLNNQRRILLLPNRFNRAKSQIHKT